MNLKDYLSSKGISHRQFAKALNVSNSTISNIVRGKRPSKKNANLIQKLTFNEVRAEDLLKQEKWKKINTYK